jgi:hypothetical protein
MEEGVAQGALHAHRCSMIKKYSTTFFTPAKPRKQMPQTELKPTKRNIPLKI